MPRCEKSSNTNTNYSMRSINKVIIHTLANIDFIAWNKTVRSQGWLSQAPSRGIETYRDVFTACLIPSNEVYVKLPKIVKALNLKYIIRRFEKDKESEENLAALQSL